MTQNENNAFLMGMATKGVVQITGGAQKLLNHLLVARKRIACTSRLQPYAQVLQVTGRTQMACPVYGIYPFTIIPQEVDE